MTRQLNDPNLLAARDKLRAMALIRLRTVSSAQELQYSLDDLTGRDVHAEILSSLKNAKDQCDRAVHLLDTVLPHLRKEAKP